MSDRVVGGGQGDACDAEGVESDKAECGFAFGSSGSDGSVSGEDASGGSAGGSAEAPIRVSVKVRVRRVRITPKEKREEYVARLERIVGFCEEVLNNPRAVEKTQLRAFEVIIHAIRMSYAIVRDVDVENLERIAEEIKEQLKERSESGAVRG